MQVYIPHTRFTRAIHFIFSWRLPLGPHLAVVCMTDNDPKLSAAILLWSRKHGLSFFPD